MSSPLQFYRSFKALLTGHGIRAVLTSGMACVEYGIQQTTKDTDWIIEVADFPSLVSLLSAKDQQGWKVRHRQFFGAPMLAPYMRGGWTCHLAIHDAADSPEHHVDLFGIPPRLAPGSWQQGYGGLINRTALAQMKKTDRPKDWPFVNALAIQALEHEDPHGLLHLREPGLLAAHAARLPAEILAVLARERPLLAHLDQTTEVELERLLIIEQSLWHAVNRERYLTYQRAWKEFFKRWNSAQPGVWPSEESFSEQHARLAAAAQDYALPASPLGAESDRRALFERAVQRAAALTRASDTEITKTLPPQTVMLP